jgi:diadenosine tetraphosphate (Ap4A) HIT family hydrolase
MVNFPMREYLPSKDPTITGFNIGMNCGQSAGQNIMHAHFHLIPRETVILQIREVVSGAWFRRR